MIHIKEASELIGLFYPTFVEIEGAIFLDSELPAEGVNLSNFSDRTEAECFYNHVHILDRFQHDAKLDGDNAENAFWDYNHPDFLLACEVAKIIVSAWQHKLEADFPEHRFRLYYTERDNPTVRFHRVRENEANWLNEKDWLNDISQGKVIVYDTGAVLA
jgi:hypothetical protein